MLKQISKRLLLTAYDSFCVRVIFLIRCGYKKLLCTTGIFMLNGIGVQNLRSFSQYAYSALKPLTVYLGRNSSGKSSLIRLFPLLRQSIEETTTGPILWYGRYVDYGNFNEAICKQSNTDDVIRLEFNISLDTSPGIRWHQLSSYGRFPLLDFKVIINLAEQNKKTYAKSVCFEIDGSSIEVVPDFANGSTTVYAQGQTTSCHIKTEGTSPKDYKFLPIISWINDASRKNNLKEDSSDNKELRVEYNSYLSRTQFRDKENAHNKLICRFAAKQLARFFHHNTKPETISEELFGIRAYSKDRLEHGVLSLFKSHSYFNKKMQDISTRNEFIDILHPLILLKHYNSIADLINSSLAKSLLSVKYLAPIRANTERFYRFQDLQVDEMDHTGSNLAMILNSFNEVETKNFRNGPLNILDLLHLSQLTVLITQLK